MQKFCRKPSSEVSASEQSLLGFDCTCVGVHQKRLMPLMPEIQKIWIFGFCRNMLFDMLSWNWFELFFCEIHLLKSLFWPYDISYAEHLRVCQLLICELCVGSSFQWYVQAQLPVLTNFIEKRKFYPVRTAKPLHCLWLCPVITCWPIELESCPNPLKKQTIS